MDRAVHAATGRAKSTSRCSSWRATSTCHCPDITGECDRRTAASLDSNRNSARRAGIYFHQGVECGTESIVGADWVDEIADFSGDTNDAAIERVSGGDFGVVVAMAA